MLGETAVAFPKISVSMSSGGTHREFASFSWGVVSYVLKVDIRMTRLKEHGLKYQKKFLKSCKDLHSSFVFLVNRETREKQRGVKS